MVVSATNSVPAHPSPRTQVPAHLRSSYDPRVGSHGASGTSSGSHRGQDGAIPPPQNIRLIYIYIYIYIYIFQIYQYIGAHTFILSMHVLLPPLFPIPCHRYHRHPFNVSFKNVNNYGSIAFWTVLISFTQFESVYYILNSINNWPGKECSAKFYSKTKATI